MSKTAITSPELAPPVGPRSPPTGPQAAGRPAGSSPGMIGSEFHKLFSVFRKYRLTVIWTRIIVMRSRPERGALRNVTKRGAGCGGRGWRS